jgi:hypothetical protein
METMPKPMTDGMQVAVRRAVRSLLCELRPAWL